MDNPPSLEDIFTRWLWARKYTVNKWSGLLLELSHRKMRGVLLGLLTNTRVSLLYSTRGMFEGGATSKYRQGEVISYNIHDANFFPKIDEWLKAMRKKYPVRKSKKRIS